MKKATMYASLIIFLVPFLTAALLPLTLSEFFSPDDLSEMGIDIDLPI
jgi:hypothetical protein